MKTFLSFAIIYLLLCSSYAQATRDTILILLPQNGNHHRLYDRNIDSNCLGKDVFYPCSSYSYPFRFESVSKAGDSVFYDLHFTPTSSVYALLGWNKSEIQQEIHRTDSILKQTDNCYCKQLLSKSFEMWQNGKIIHELPIATRRVVPGNFASEGLVKNFIKSASKAVLMLAEEIQTGKYIIQQVDLMVLSPVRGNRHRF